MNSIFAKLVEQGLLTADAAQHARDALAGGRSLDDALREAPGASEEKVLRFLAAEFDLPFIDLEKDAAKYVPAKELLSRFPARILLDHRLMPLEENGDGVIVLTSKVFDTSGLDELRLASGIEVHPALAPSVELRAPVVLL